MIVPDTDTAIAYLKQMRLDKVPVAIDTETYGVTVRGVVHSALSLNRSRIITFQTVSAKCPALVFVSDKVHECGLDLRKIMPHIKALMLDRDVLKVFHNYNYDGNVFLNHGVKTRNIYCTMIAGACADENMSNSLKERAVLVGMLLKKTKTVNFDDLEALAEYGADDAIATLKLYDMYEKNDVLAKKSSRKIKLGGKVYDLSSMAQKEEPDESGMLRLQGVRRQFYSLQELPIVRMVVKMERQGVKIDLKKLREIDDDISVSKAHHQKKIFAHAGKTFNINAGGQIADILYNDLGLTCPDDCYTAKGAPQTNARALWYQYDKHPIVEHILAYKKLEKLQSTYTSPTKGLPYYCDDSGYIHATANNVGTHTFRFTYSNPNLQTIPSKMDSHGIRKAFGAPKGFLCAVFDYSQIEVRMQAMFSRDPLMVEELSKPNGDIYLRTAKEFGSADPKADRTIFKIIVLALQYGMGPWKLADNLTQAGYPTTQHEAREYIKMYFGRVYTKLPEMWYDLFQEHKRKGYVTTLLGRPRKVQNFETAYNPSSGKFGLNMYERALVNNVMQGSAADFIKQAMIRLDRAPLCKRIGYSQRLQVHDEVFGYIREDQADQFGKIMSIATQLPRAPFALTRELVVPILAEGGTGVNWVEAK